MPRMGVWLVGAATVAGVYTLYQRYIDPFYQVAEIEEAHMEKEKLNVNSLWQQFAILENTLNTQIKSRKLLYQKTNNNHEDDERGSCWFTNQEKLLFYLSLQEVRNYLFSIDRNDKVVASAVGNKEVKKMLKQLKEMEMQHCDVLHFRETSPTFLQAVKSRACFFVYCVAFWWIDVVCLLAHSPSMEFSLKQQVSQRLLQTLEIETELRVSPQTKRVLEGEEDGLQGGRCLPLFQHWIEEVGFYAALPQSPRLAHCLSSTHRLTQSPFPEEHKVSYGALWSARLSSVHLDPSDDVSLLRLVDPCIGYPFVRLPDPTNGPVLPVAVSGLPSLLYTLPQYSTSDDDGVRRRNALLRYIQEEQFHQREKQLAKRHETKDPQPLTSKTESTPAERFMQHWRESTVFSRPFQSPSTARTSAFWYGYYNGVLPLFSWNTNMVYGGLHRKGQSSAAGKLIYYVGDTSTENGSESDWVNQIILAFRSASI